MQTNILYPNRFPLEALFHGLGPAAGTTPPRLSQALASSVATLVNWFKSTGRALLSATLGEVAATPGPDPHVLVIDDDKNLTELVAMCLQQEGIRVTSVTTGEQGVLQALREKPNLILLDVGLEGMNGFDVLRQLRRDRRASACKILMLTADRRIQCIDRGMELGADEYFMKPIDPDSFGKTIARKLNLRAA